MAVKFPKLFEPINIGKVTIKNRIALAPMGVLGLTNADGTYAQRAIDYYVERVKGGTGLIITGVMKVETDVESIGMNSARVTNRACLFSLGELSEAVHSLGAKIFVQLTAGFGRVLRGYVRQGVPISASAVPYYWDPSITCRALETEEVESIVKAFGAAAEILAGSGVDGVELHGHEGYLFDQFTTAIWNKRTDKYGGDLQGRLTLPIEVLAAIKKGAGADFPVQYRFGLKHYIKGLNAGAVPGEKFVEAGRDIEEGLEMARLLEKAGYDSLHVDAGCYDSWYWAHPPVYQEHGCMVDMAARAKKAVKIPVIAVGRLETPELAEQVIAQGQADMIAIGHGLLADPYWPVKVRENRVDSIRPCIGCHDGCMGRFAIGRPLSCAVNPACGREKLYELSKAETPRKVLVVGGGAAGMEAARVSAIRGHKVTLYEKEKALGGHLIEASVPDFKKDLKRLLQWYEGQLDDSSVEVKLGAEATVTLIRKEKPDVVFIATGSKPVRPEIPGIDKPEVITSIDLLLGKKKAGKVVSVVGGGLIGCETALWLAKQGKKVSILEALPQPMSTGIPVPHMNRMMLLDLLAVNNVDIITGACVQEITEEGAIVTGATSKKKAIKADTVVLALGLKSNDELYKALDGKVVDLYALGDCREARNIMGAIWDAYEVARGV